MKKLLILIFTIFIFITQSFAFSDTNNFFWANKAIDKWSLNGYISGYPDGTFKGNNNITRAEVISVINKLNNSDTKVSKRAGKDVASNNWFFEDMGKAKEDGLISVDENGNLRPNEYATREDVIVILAKLLDISYSGNLENAKVKNFLDNNEISSENYKRVAGIVEEGFVSGYADDTIRPQKYITRAEFISIIDNAIQNVYSSGKYNNKIINGNVVINGEDVEIKNSEIRGKVFILDGARDGMPNLSKTRVSKGVNSRVGNVLIENDDEYQTLSEYNYNNPEEVNQPVFVKISYSETDWTNDDVSIKVSAINNSDVEFVDGNKVIAKENGEYVIQYYYKGKLRSVVAKVDNIDDTAPIVTAVVDNKGPYAEVRVDVSEDTLSKIKEISCSNGVVNKPNSETGEIEKLFTIDQEGEYTIIATDEAGNTGSTKVVISDLREPDVTYRIEHYLQDELGNYPAVANKTITAIGQGKSIVKLADIEKVSEAGFKYVYGTLDDNQVTEVILTENIVIKLYYARTIEIKYEGNGGTNIPETQNSLLNDEIKISDKVPVKEGYKFIGWATSQADETTKYNPGDDFIENDNTTLYAVWKGADINYKVEHYLQQYDGSYLDTPTRTDELGGENFEIKLISGIEKLQESNYFYERAECNGENVTQVVLSDGLLIKIFYKYQYTISFQVEGMGIFRTQNKFFNQDISIITSRPQVDYYSLIGWSLNENDTTIHYYPGDNFNLNQDITLYAVLKPRDVQVSRLLFYQQENGLYLETDQGVKVDFIDVETEIEINSLEEVLSPKDGYVLDYAEVDGQRVDRFILEKPTYIKIYFKHRVLGIKRALDSQVSAWDRIEEAKDLTALATKDGSEVQNNFDNIYPWSEIKSYNYDTTQGIVTAWYGDDNFKFDGSNGEVLTRIPEFYYKHCKDDDYEYYYITKYAKDGYIKSEEFSVGRYKMSEADNKGHSYSGTIPSVNKTITEHRELAKANGDGFGQMDWRYFTIQMLYLVEYADYNSQNVLGSGITSLPYQATDKALIDENNTNRIIISGEHGFMVGQLIDIDTQLGYRRTAKNRTITAIEDYDLNGTPAKSIAFDGTPVDITTEHIIYSVGQKSGQLDSLGMKSGSLINDGKRSVMYRGIEDIFGNVFEWIDGININDYAVLVCYAPDKYLAGSSNEDYIELGYLLPDISARIQELTFDSNHPLITLPKTIGADIIGDYYGIQSGVRVLRVGGRYNGGTSAGLWFFYPWNGPTYFDVNCGARLLRY